MIYSPSKIYLIDTSCFVKYLSNSLPKQGIVIIDKAIKNGNCAFSFITYIEALSFKAPTLERTSVQEDIFGKVGITGINPKIIETSITLRLQYSIATTDAIIAASALEYGYALIADDEKAFRQISELELYNPRFQ